MDDTRARHRRRARRTALAAGAATGGLLVAGLAVPAQAARAPHATAHATTAFVRVDQVGFLPTETKQAYVMAAGKLSGERYRVLDAAGRTVLSGSVGTSSRGSWNAAYPDVYPVDFSALRTPGTYRVQLTGGAPATSPTFRVEAAGGLYGKLVADGVTFFQNQRDGSDVIPGALGREPSHLHDAKATVYDDPHFASGGSDTITDEDLTEAGATADVEGGWFDAGDFLKFTHTTAFGDALLFASQRALGGAAPASLEAEAHFGEEWLNRMWDQSAKTLYLQVGIGEGNAAGTFTGDHDLWRLPERDDGDTSSADRYSAAHRPVFRAAAPGARISPNLAGRVSAAFALAAQVDAASDPRRAAAEYRAATSLYAMADTTNPPSPLTTALPNAYYPESTWHDDMEFGGAEIALAAHALGHDPSAYLKAAATWAKDYIAHDKGDTFNLYDTSALAHADLIRAIEAAGRPSGLAVTTGDLLADLRRQVSSAAAKAGADVFHAGGDYDDFDVDSHTFGFLTTEALYEQAGGGRGYAGFATEQRDWLLGANAWGASFMVGEGTDYPRCMQHQVGNLKGSTDGSAPVDTGAVVNGPNGSGQFSGGLGDYQDGMRHCPASGDPYSAFTGHGSRYVDDVRSWQTSEPALDMTGSAILGAALQEANADR
ncbi:glycoside hydrolase family 9 protein [Streptomyces sp. ICBB 8177]|uniref:glycoside hydrolase family 9 protein n=1 Tax=Streptomyces sp. ICBB 8177 TaxID=563922 RepID=UPI0018EEB665|nr:glycoside hydrolase family 9 protein [Streptomyces sp. ICBB 8177]